MRKQDEINDKSYRSVPWEYLSKKTQLQLSR